MDKVVYILSEEYHPNQFRRLFSDASLEKVKQYAKIYPGPKPKMIISKQTIETLEIVPKEDEERYEKIITCRFCQKKIKHGDNVVVDNIEYAEVSDVFCSNSCYIEFLKNMATKRAIDKNHVFYDELDWQSVPIEKKDK